MVKMVKCKICGADVAKGVKKCPGCGGDLRSFFRKHKIITALIVFVVLVGFAGMGSGGSSTDTAAGTSAGSTPSSTVSKDTSTPTPAPVVVADTSTPSSGLSSEEFLYINDMSTYSTNLGEHFTEMSSTISSGDVGNSVWIHDMAVCIVNVRDDIQDMRSISVPSRFAGSHSMILDACDYYEKATDYIVAGVDELDADKIKKATSYMKLGNAKIEEATAELHKFTE
jgi:hypothetical protein